MTAEPYADLAANRARRPRKRRRLRRWLKRGLLVMLGLILITASAGVTYKLIWSARADDARDARRTVRDRYMRQHERPTPLHPNEDGIAHLHWASETASDYTCSGEGYQFQADWMEHADWTCDARFLDFVRRERELVNAEFCERLDARIAALGPQYDAIEQGLSAPDFRDLDYTRDVYIYFELLNGLLEQRRARLWLDSPVDAVADWVELYGLTRACDRSMRKHFIDDMRIHASQLEELSMLLDGVDPAALPLDALAAALATPTNLDYHSLREYWAKREGMDTGVGVGDSWGSSPAGWYYQFLYQDRRRAAVRDAYRTGIEALNAEDPRPILATIYDAFDPEVPRLYCYCCGTYAPYLYESYLRLAAAAAYLHVGKLAVAQLQRWRATGSFDAGLSAGLLIDPLGMQIMFEPNASGFTFSWYAPYWGTFDSEPQPRTKRWSYTLPETVED